MTKAYRVTARVRLGNRITTAMAKRGKGPAWVLTTIGRSSGERRDVPVTPVDCDGHRYLVAPYGEVAWVRNLRKTPHATLRRGGASVRVDAVPVEGQEAAAALSKYYAENEKYVKSYIDIPGDGTNTDFLLASDRYPVFRIGI
jgi:deazaflavin-dependent oxidoreductase (nitroreductase family)